MCAPNQPTQQLPASWSVIAIRFLCIFEYTRPEATAKAGYLKLYKLCFNRVQSVNDRFGRPEKGTDSSLRRGFLYRIRGIVCVSLRHAINSLQSESVSEIFPGEWQDFGLAIFLAIHSLSPPFRSRLYVLPVWRFKFNDYRRGFDIFFEICMADKTAVC